MSVQVLVDVKGEIRGTGVIRDKHGNVKGQFEFRGEATQAQFNKIEQQLKEKQNGSDTLDRGP